LTCGHNNRIDGATYDPAGNMLLALGNQYWYDDENRVVSASLALGGSVSYNYNAAGQRVRKYNGSTVEEYLYDAAGHIAPPQVVTAPTAGGPPG
jgi:YD repeat-containing protein